MTYVVPIYTPEDQKKAQILFTLFYSVGKQCSPILIQYQKKNGMYTHRHDLIKYSSSSMFVQKANNRTTLVNELVFDFDYDDFATPQTQAVRLRPYTLTQMDTEMNYSDVYEAMSFYVYALISYLCGKGYSYSIVPQNKSYCVYDSGSRGIHIHTYNNDYYLRRDLWLVKRNLLVMFNCDTHLKDTTTTITIEYAKNSKTQRYKKPLSLLSERVK